MTSQKFAAMLNDFVGQANHRAALTRVFTQFSTRSPQIEYVLDRDRAKVLGVPLSSIFNTLQTFLGGAYINDFNLFGRTYRVTAQAEASARNTPESVNSLYVRTAQGDMVPLSALVSIKPAGARVHRALQRLPGRHHQRLARHRVQLRAGDHAMEQLADSLPRGFRLRVDRHHLPGKTLRRPDGADLRHGDRVRVSGAGGAV